MTKEEGQSPVVMNSFQHLIRSSLPLADASFIPVHRKGFSDAILIKVLRFSYRDVFENIGGVMEGIWSCL